MTDLAKSIQVFRDLTQGKTTEKVVHDVYPRVNWNKKKNEFVLTKEILWSLFKYHSPADYKITGENQKVIYTVLRYFLIDDNFNEYKLIKTKPSLDKGLLIYGSYGVGKSLLFDIISKCGKELMTKANCNKLWYNSISAGTFIEDYMKNTRIKESNFDLKNYYTGKLYIDDLGFENKTFNKTELFAEILFERNRRNVKTHVTTNLNPAELVDRYGTRIGDRLPQMFNIISWNGESFRE